MSILKKKGKSEETTEGVPPPEPEAPPEDWSRVELATLAPPKKEAPRVKGYVGCACGETLPIGVEESYVEAIQRCHAGH